MSIQTERERASQVIVELYQNSFFQRYWRAIGRFLGRGKSVSIWVSAGLVMGVNLLLGVAVSALLRETKFTTWNAILVNAMWVTWAYFAILITIHLNGRLVEFLALRFTTSLQNEQHLHELLLWANQWLGRQIPQLLFSLLYGLTIACLGFYGIYQTTKFSFGTILIYFVNFFHTGIALYGGLALIAFLFRLKNWDLVLYPDDPASSPILLQISNEINNFSLSAAIIFATLILPLRLLGAFNLTIIIVYVVFTLIPLITLFVLANQAFSQQITRVKFERLKELQSKIMKLSSDVETLDKDSIVHIKNLMDYHDRVKSGRNSLYSSESFLNLLRSLALPILSVILGTIDVWQRIFGQP
jgi:hypothetical protein